jgi:hypothetical protein
LIETKFHKPWVILERLTDVILENVEGCIVEVGMGRSTYIFAHFAEIYGRKMYACDKNGNRAKAIQEDIEYENLIVYPGRSFEFMEEFDDKPAIVFLDGNHRYRVVSVEANFFLDKLVPGGVMFLHDTYFAVKWYERKEKKGKAHRYDTYKIRQDLEANEDVWCLTFPYTAAECGLTIAMKKEEGRPFYRM